MYTMIARPAEAPASPPEQAGKSFCAAVGIDDGLYERLALDRAGRPFVPVSLAAVDEPAALAAQFELLMRPEAVGGGEALLKENGEATGEAAMDRLHRRLAAGGEAGALRPFLASLRQELGQLDRELEGRAETIGRELHSCQAALRAWQEATSHERGLLGNLWGWLIGGAGQLSLPQAVALWNERERLSLARHAISTARAVAGRLADEVDILLEGQEAMLREAERALRAARARLAERRPAADGYAPWTWQADPEAIAAHLVRRAPAEGLVATLLARAGEAEGAEGLAASARALAEAEAERLVRGLSIADAIVAEAGDDGGEELDPLVLVGQQLLGELERAPSWRLQRTARPRVEVVQVTGDGEPLFQLEGLGAAAYGDGADRLGFVRLESGVSSEDLRAMHEGEEAFAQVLALRNLYVVEELAREAAPRPAGPNGLHPVDAWRAGDD